MGLLDDAIREHLELKRRRGADSQEVNSQEQEALGPGRRGPEPLELPDLSGSEVAYGNDEMLGDSEPDDLTSQARDPSPARAPAADSSPDVSAPPDPLPSPTGPAPASPPPDPRSDLDADVGQPTVAFDVAAAYRDEDPAREGSIQHDPAPPPSEPTGEADPAPPSEDVLEETPEFLQETPEHDRLWFEQRPPRDFDFDK